MKNLSQVLQDYAAYHQKAATKITHFIGVPLVVFGLMIFLGWFYLAVKPVFEVSLLWLIVIAACIYYIKLDRQLGLCVSAALIILCLAATYFTQDGFNKLSLIIFLISFIGGWIIQFIGHYFEKRKPALLDNLGQALAAPIFLAAELAVLLKKRTELKAFLL